MNFDNQMPNWENEGAEPSSTLKTNGFAGGNKLPANIVNFFISIFSKAITEIQTKLSNVDNTSDLNKPISTATQTALDGKANSSHSHAQSDVNGLTSALSGKVPTTRKINNKPLSSDITLDKDDVGLSNAAIKGSITYTGTGIYGSSANSTVIDCSALGYVPTVLFICATGGGQFPTGIIYPTLSRGLVFRYNSVGTKMLYVSVSGKRISFYDETAVQAEDQLNHNGKTYNCFTLI